MFDLSLAVTLALSTVQDKSQLPPINPDRPDFTDSAYIVPQGKWQVEIGARQFVSTTVTNDWGNQPLFRYALSKRFEVRLGLPSYFSGTAGSGLADGFAGFKYRLQDGVDNKTPSLAIIFTTSVPGRAAFSEKKLQPQLVFVAEQVWGVYDLQVNFSTAYLSTGGQQYSLFQATASLNFPVKGKLNGFFETVWNSTQGYRGPRGGLLHTGLSYLLSNDIMLDCAVGRGLNGVGKDWFFGAGLSFRF